MLDKLVTQSALVLTFAVVAEPRAVSARMREFSTSLPNVPPLVHHQALRRLASLISSAQATKISLSSLILLSKYSCIVRW